MIVAGTQFWLYVTFVGLVLDFLGALGLAIESMNWTSNWVGQNIRGPYLRRTYARPTDNAIKELQREGKLDRCSEGFEQLLSVVEEAFTTGEIKSVKPDLVTKLVLDPDQSLHGTPTPVYAEREDGSRRPVDGFGRLRQRRNRVTERGQERLEDVTTALPSVVLTAGFGLQLVSFYIHQLL